MKNKPNMSEWERLMSEAKKRGIALPDEALDKVAGGAGGIEEQFAPTPEMLDYELMQKDHFFRQYCHKCGSTFKLECVAFDSGAMYYKCQQCSAGYKVTQELIDSLGL